MRKKFKDLLKIQIETTFSRKILTSADCQQLAEDVFKKTGEKLNNNTLRRYFGLVKSDYLPSLSTYHILSRYCGFSSFDELVAYKANNIKNEEESSALLNYLVSLFKNIPDLQGGDPTCMNLVKHTIFFFDQEPSVIYPFQREVAKTKTGQDYYFEEFVNIDKLNGYYGEGLRYYLGEKKGAEPQIFGHSLLCLRNWLTMNKEGVEKHYKEVMQHPLHNRVHPFVQGRHFATRLYHAEAHGLDMGPIVADTMEAYRILQPSFDHYQQLPCFELIVAEAFLLVGRHTEAIYYANSGLKKLNKGHFTNLNASLFYALHLFKACALANSGEEEKAKTVYQAIDPTNFYFLSRQYLNIFYLSLGIKLRKVRSAEAQVQFLVQQTGFQRLVVACKELSIHFTNSHVAWLFLNKIEQ